MPKCCNCKKTQARLNKGGFCKACYQHKDNPIITDGVINIKDINSTVNMDGSIEDGNYEIVNDRNVINLFKESMLNERKWNEDMQLVLKQQVEFLQQEIITKNTLIEQLMFELHNKETHSNTTDNKRTMSNARNSDVTLPAEDKCHRAEVFESTLSEIHNKDNTPLDNNKNASCDYDDNKINKPPTLYPRCKIITHANRYNALYNDFDKTSDCEMEKPEEIYELPMRTNDEFSTKRPNIVVNQYPENDSDIYRKQRVVPGNSTYAGMVGQGRKILLLSDSILGRIQMKRLNIDINVGHAFRKYYPGATPTEMAYYSIPTLKSAKPDVVVIHTGTNSIFKDNTNDAANTIFNVVKICREHGVNEVFISGITYRNRNMAKVSQLNKFIESQQQIYDFKFINNDNINEKDVGNDKLHLNYSGTVKIANNITNAINTLHTG